MLLLSRGIEKHSSTRKTHPTIPLCNICRTLVMQSTMSVNNNPHRTWMAQTTYACITKLLPVTWEITSLNGRAPSFLYTGFDIAGWYQWQALMGHFTFIEKGFLWCSIFADCPLHAPMIASIKNYRYMMSDSLSERVASQPQNLPPLKTRLQEEWL